MRPPGASLNPTWSDLVYRISGDPTEPLCKYDRFAVRDCVFTPGTVASFGSARIVGTHLVNAQHTDETDGQRSQDHSTPP